MDFEDAVEFLAKRAGITIKRSATDAEGKRYDRSKLLQMNKDAAKFFHASLFEKNPDSLIGSFLGPIVTITSNLSQNVLNFL